MNITKKKTFSSLFHSYTLLYKGKFKFDIFSIVNFPEIKLKIPNTNYTKNYYRYRKCLLYYIYLC